MIEKYDISEETIKNNAGFLYVTVNKCNGKSYIGVKHFNKTGSKWDEYLGSGKILKQAIKKYGKESFYKIIVQIVKTEDELFNIEKEIIKINKAVKNENFYNISNGGHGGDSFSGYSKEEFKKYCNNLKGENNPFYGRKHSKKSKELMIKRRTGENHWLFGKHQSEETKKKLSDSRKQYYKTHIHHSSITTKIVLKNETKIFDSIAKALEYTGFQKRDYSRIKKYDIPKFKNHKKQKMFDNILEIYENNNLVFSKIKDNK